VYVRNLCVNTVFCWSCIGLMVVRFGETFGGSLIVASGGGWGGEVLYCTLGFGGVA